MASYQDLETRLQVIERKLDFLFQIMTFKKRTPSTLMPGEFVVETINMHELYKDASNGGGLASVTTNGD